MLLAADGFDISQNTLSHDGAVFSGRHLTKDYTARIITP